MSEMPKLILIDGPTDAGKSGVANKIVWTLGFEGVKCEGSGMSDFFRSIAADALTKLRSQRTDGHDGPTVDELLAAATEVAQDPPVVGFKRSGGLYTPAVSQYVSVVSSLDVVQEAGAKYRTDMAEAALNSDVPVVYWHGQNLDTHLGELLRAWRIVPVLKLLCVPELLPKNASPEQEKAAAETERARLLDSSRKVAPYCEPDAFVSYDCQGVATAIAQARDRGSSAGPLPIRVTNKPAGDGGVIEELAWIALDLPV